MHGDITYLELALIEEKETVYFYQDLFNWTLTDSFISKQRYIMFETPGKRLSGGFDASLKPSQIGVQIYIECEDINQTIKRIQNVHEKAKVSVPKTLISSDYGYFALIIDPSGNQIGLQENIK
jgi:uncharacterized protein